MLLLYIIKYASTWNTDYPLYLKIYSTQYITKLNTYDEHKPNLNFNLKLYFKQISEKYCYVCLINKYGRENS